MTRYEVFLVPDVLFGFLQPFCVRLFQTTASGYCRVGPQLLKCHYKLQITAIMSKRLDSVQTFTFSCHQKFIDERFRFLTTFTFIKDSIRSSRFLYSKIKDEDPCQWSRLPQLYQGLTYTYKIERTQALRWVSSCLVVSGFSSQITLKLYLHQNLQSNSKMFCH